MKQSIPLLFFFTCLIKDSEQGKSAAEIFKNCSTISPKTLNDSPSLCSSILLNASCLNHINAADLSPECLSHLQDQTIADMKTDTIKRLSTDDSPKLPMEPKFVKAFLANNNWTENKAKVLISKIVAKTTLMRELLKDNKTKEELFEHLLTKASLPELNKNLCCLITKEILSQMQEDSLSTIKKECLQNIKVEAFQGIDHGKLKKVNVEAMEGLSFEQAYGIKKASLHNLTEEQAKNLGYKVEAIENNSAVIDNSAQNKNSKEGDKKADEKKKDDKDGNNSDPVIKKKLEIRRMQEQFEDHPCIAAKYWKQKVSPKTWKALEERCKAVWAYSAGSKDIVNLYVMAFTVAIALAITFI